MRQIADYDIIQQLGEGSQGQFWLAKTPARLELDTPVVALKTLSHAASDDDFARLTAHLRLYASIDSPSLVPIYDVGQQGNLIYMAGDQPRRTRTPRGRHPPPLHPARQHLDG